MDHLLRSFHIDVADQTLLFAHYHVLFVHGQPWHVHIFHQWDSEYLRRLLTLVHAQIVFEFDDIQDKLFLVVL